MIRYMKKLIVLAEMMAAFLLMPVAAGCKKEEPIRDDVITYSISLSQKSITLSEGETYQLKAEYTPFGKSVVQWKSSNDKVVSVTEEGLVSALIENGQETVTAELYSLDGLKLKAKATCEVVLKTFYVKDILIDAKIPLTIGHDYQLQPTIMPEEAIGTPLSYQVVSGGDYVTVSSTGLVHPKAEGKAKVWIKAQDARGYTMETLLEVSSEPVYPTALAMKDFVTETVKGKSFEVGLDWTPVSATVRNYSVSSSNTSVATVSKTSSGFKVNALKAGDTDITVTWESKGKTDNTLSRALTVHADEASIAWTTDPSSWTSKGLIVGETARLAAKVSNLNDVSVVYTSSDGSVASVTASGTVSAVGRGYARITARSGANPELVLFSDLFFVYGKPSQIGLTGVGESGLFVRFGGSRKISFQIRDASGYASRQDWTLSLSQPSGTNMGWSWSQSGNTIEVAFSSSRTSASATLKGSVTISAKNYSGVKTSFDLYDAMYGADDIKPFDGLRISNMGNCYVYEGGYRGSGYFESSARSSSFSRSTALIVYLGNRPSERSLLKSLKGIAGECHGFAVCYKSLSRRAWWVKEQNEGDAVKLSSLYKGFWSDQGMVVPTTNTGVYGYEITAGEKYYNHQLSSKKKDYTVLPVSALEDADSGLPDTDPSAGTNSGWYVPTSGEWYKMQTCIESGATIAETMAKIGEYLKAMGGTAIADTGHYWSCQEYKDDPDGNAVYMTGLNATKSGDYPTLHDVKQKENYVRPFIAF